ATDSPNDANDASDAGADADAAQDASNDADGGTITPTVTVVRVGDGVAALTNNATPVFLETHKIDGTLVGSAIALPTVANGPNKPFAVSGTATSEGDLTRSANGHYVVIAGYALAVGASDAGVASTASMTVNRVVARVDSSGAIDTTTALNNAYDGNNVRG